MNDSKLTDEVIQELITLLEDHMVDGVKKPEGEPAPAIPDDEAMEGDSAPLEGLEHEASEAPGEETAEERTKRMLMEKFGGK